MSNKLTLIAIDIVLLPEDKFLDTCLNIHKTSKQQSKHIYTLSKEGYVPHLSLVMGRAYISNIKAITQVLTTFSNIQIPIITNGMQGSWLTIEKTPELLKLHTELMQALSPLLEHNTPATDDMFFGKPFEGVHIEPGVFKWVDNFDDFACDAYEPHITLRATNETDISFPIETTTSTLALFHLSDYNTCKKLLWSNK